MIKIIDLLIDLIKRQEKEQDQDERVPLRIEAPSYEENQREDDDEEEESRVIIIDL